MAKFNKIIVKNNENELIKAFITRFKKKLKKNKRFSFVLTGGESPINLYKKLAKEKDINWKQIDFFISDERYVSEKSSSSNKNICKKNLLSKINILKKQIYFISTNNKSVKKDSELYEKKILKYFNNKKIIFDLSLIGMGNDGHIAGLFKKNVNIKTNKNVCFIKKKDFTRIGLTLKCINSSKDIFLWTPTKKKLNIVNKILLDKKLKYPVSFLKKKNSSLFYCY